MAVTCCYGIQLECDDSCSQYSLQGLPAIMPMGPVDTKLTVVRASASLSMPALATLLAARTSFFVIFTVFSTSPPARAGSSLSPGFSRACTPYTHTEIWCETAPEAQPHLDSLEDMTLQHETAQNAH